MLTAHYYSVGSGRIGCCVAHEAGSLMQQQLTMAVAQADKVGLFKWIIATETLLRAIRKVIFEWIILFGRAFNYGFHC